MGDSPQNSVHGAPWPSLNIHNRIPSPSNLTRNGRNQEGHPDLIHSNMPILAPNFQNPLLGNYLRPTVTMVNGLPNIRPTPSASGPGGLVGLPLPTPQSRPPLHRDHYWGSDGSPRMQSHAPPLACNLPPSPLPPSSPPQTRKLMAGCFSFYRRRNHQRSSWGGGTGFFLPRVTSSSEGSSSGRTDWGKAPAVPLPPPPPASSTRGRTRRKNKKKALADVSKDEDLARVEEQDKSELSPEDFLPKEWEY